MYYSKLENRTYLVRLEKGEQISSSINRFCEKTGIRNASFMCIGSVENPVLAYYRVDTKKYNERAMKGIFEVTSLLGNVAVFEGKPLLHCHVSLSDEEMRAFGGHFVEGIVAASLEVILQDLGSNKIKKHDEEVGLKFFELDEHL